MKKKDAARNMLWGWALIGIALMFTFAAWVYVIAVQNWVTQGVLQQ